MQLVAVAASGGRDSTALLHCTLRMARPLGLRVVALHVHHGLQPEADDWLAQIKRQCHRWGAAFASHRLAGPPAAGESVEAWARRERYAALAAMAQDAGAPLVLLAHHRRDQAETWLLQALRGGGPAGLSAMPQRAQHHGLHWARPWLDRPRSEIDAYVRRYRLQAIEDASNADPRFARSRLRQQVWPALQAAFADVETSLAQSSRRAQEAAALAAEMAKADGENCCTKAALHVVPWLALSAARRANLLRAWLVSVCPDGAPETLVQRLQQELPRCQQGRFPAPGGELHLYRGVLRWAAPPVVFLAPASVHLNLANAGVYALPGWPGELQVQACSEGGVRAGLLQQVQAAARQGGEQFQRSPNTPPRSLKKAAQFDAVPAWRREGPLLHTARGDLLFVSWLGVDARCLAETGTPQFCLRWLSAL